MKKVSLLLEVLIAGFLMVIFIQPVFGNGISIPHLLETINNPYIQMPFLLLLFIIGVLVEYKIYGLSIFKNHSLAEKKRTDIFLTFRINLITFPLTQLLVYFFYINFESFFWFWVVLIEVLVVLIESFLLRIELDRFTTAPLTAKFILVRSFSANVTSFLIGLLLYLPIILVNNSSYHFLAF